MWNIQFSRTHKYNGLLSDERAGAGAHTCRGSEGQVGWTQNYRGRNYPPRDRYTTAQTVIDIPLLRPG
jgi:hypothetical protein